METRKIELALDTAKRWYAQGGELRQMALGVYKKEELVYRIIPKTWNEFCDYRRFERGECYISDDSRIVEKVEGNYRISPSNDNVLPSKEAAEQHLALMRLHQLRDAWREGWLPDWTDERQSKYVIINLHGIWKTAQHTTTSRFLAFQDKKRADEFMDCFIDLIRKAGDLI